MQGCNQTCVLIKGTRKQLQSIGGSDECKTMLEEDLKMHVACESKLADLLGCAARGTKADHDGGLQHHQPIACQSFPRQWHVLRLFNGNFAEDRFSSEWCTIKFAMLERQ